MADKNVQMKVLNSSGAYDTINPASNASLIKCADGTSVEAKFTTKSNLSTLVSTSLSAASWTGTSAPYQYVLSVAAAKPAPVRIEIGPAATATAEQRAAWRDAMIYGVSQAAGSITLGADGDKPTADIPVEITVRGDCE